VEEIANEDFEFSVTQQGAAFPGISTGGESDVTVTKSPKNKAVDKQVLTDKVEQSNAFNDWGCMGPLEKAGTGTLISTIITGIFVIIAGSTKCKAEGKFCMLKGDFALCQCSGIEQPSGGPPPPPPVPFVGACKIEITDAGQTKCLGN